uniref:Uncharacterized protein n=1 Tax=Lactuca sativa TaxID=4236 RepID=A0A9R1XDX4_LACSA|nr:hypothetical protein LSAT_V11C500258280 [Lactuca sativa]
MDDVYRTGTFMELVRVLALSFSDDGKCVKFLFKDPWEKKHLQECHYSMQEQERFWSTWIGVLIALATSFHAPKAPKVPASVGMSCSDIDHKA